MFESCLQKQKDIETLFDDCLDNETKYDKIMALGKELAPYPENLKDEAHRVHGCQSRMYLKSSLLNGKVRFLAASDALISAGLASLLIHVYNDESPETLLKCPPDFLEKIGIGQALTPSRANGLYSLHLRMKQDALKLLIESQKG